MRAIHRLIDGLPTDFDLLEALAPWFEAAGCGPRRRRRGRSPPAMVDAGRLAPRRSPHGDAAAAPAAGAFGDVPRPRLRRLDVAPRRASRRTSSRSSTASTNVRAAVASGAAQAGVLLRPATVAQIEATAHGGERMPPKTTFFHPKPKTGLVFRSLG